MQLKSNFLRLPGSQEANRNPSANMVSERRRNFAKLLFAAVKAVGSEGVERLELADAIGATDGTVRNAMLDPAKAEGEGKPNKIGWAYAAGIAAFALEHGALSRSERDELLWAWMVQDAEGKPTVDAFIEAAGDEFRTMRPRAVQKFKRRVIEARLSREPASYPNP